MSCHPASRPESDDTAQGFTAEFHTVEIPAWCLMYYRPPAQRKAGHSLPCLFFTDNDATRRNLAPIKKHVWIDSAGR